MKKTLFLFLIVSICSCDNNHHAGKSFVVRNNINFYQINFEYLLKTKKLMFLSEIASDVEYIPLQTKDDCAIGEHPQYFFADSLIFVNNINHILKFSRDGKFLSRIGNTGRGPNEIDHIRTMSVLPEKNLIAIQKNSEQKLLYFSFDGSFIKSTSIPRFYNLKVLKDGNFLGYEKCFTGSEKYTFLLTTENGDTLAAVNNEDTWKSQGSRFVDLAYEYEPFYMSDNLIHFKSLYNDTVYHAISDRIEPDYFIDMGKYKLPSELIPERVLPDPSKMEMFFKKALKYYYCNVFESSGNVYLKSSHFKESDISYFVYNKNARDGFMLTDRDNESAGIINDWDMGVTFWPKGSFGENKIYMPVSVMKIKEALSENKSYPGNNMEKMKRLKDLISGLDDTGNPILMVVTLKK